MAFPPPGLASLELEVEEEELGRHREEFLEEAVAGERRLGIGPECLIGLEADGPDGPSRQDLSHRGPGGRRPLQPDFADPAEQALIKD